MSAEATNAPELSGDLPGTPAKPSLRERAREIVDRLERAAVDLWLFVRFVCFLGFLLLAVLSFWLWAVSLVVALIRGIFAALMYLLLWLAGGVAPRRGAPDGALERLQYDLRRGWSERTVAYEAIARPVARHLVQAQRLGRTFWHWSWFFKGVAIVALFFGIVLPGSYVLPRPYDVQITDDNAIEYDNATKQTRYLVHALDMHKAGKHREFLNEDAWYLGKINSQGLKSKLLIGHTYRLWVVGLRWYYAPRLYPNIISATEIDEHGHTVTSTRIQAPAPNLPPTH